MISDKKTNGLTLVELIITMAVLIVVVTAVFSTMSMMLRTFVNFNTMNEHNDHYQNIRLALLDLVRDARDGGNAEECASDSEVLVITTSQGEIRYFWSGEGLTREVQGGGAIVFAPIFYEGFEFEIDNNRLNIYFVFEGARIPQTSIALRRFPTAQP